MVVPSVAGGRRPREHSGIRAHPGTDRHAAHARQDSLSGPTDPPCRGLDLAPSRPQQAARPHQTSCPRHPPSRRRPAHPPSRRFPERPRGSASHPRRHRGLDPAPGRKQAARQHQRAAQDTHPADGGPPIRQAASPRGPEALPVTHDATVDWAWHHPARRQAARPASNELPKRSPSGQRPRLVALAPLHPRNRPGARQLSRSAGPPAVAAVPWTCRSDTTSSASSQLPQAHTTAAGTLENLSTNPDSMRPPTHPLQTTLRSDKKPGPRTRGKAPTQPRRICRADRIPPVPDQRTGSRHLGRRLHSETHPR